MIGRHTTVIIVNTLEIRFRCDICKKGFTEKSGWRSLMLDALQDEVKMIMTKNTYMQEIDVYVKTFL